MLWKEYKGKMNAKDKYLYELNKIKKDIQEVQRWTSYFFAKKYKNFSFLQ